MPAELVVATACAHQPPTAESDEKQIAAWLDAAALIAGADPVTYGLVVKKGMDLLWLTLPGRKGISATWGIMTLCCRFLR